MECGAHNVAGHQKRLNQTTWRSCPAYEIEVIKLHVLDLDFGLELRFEKWRCKKYKNYNKMFEKIFGFFFFLF